MSDLLDTPAGATDHGIRCVEEITNEMRQFVLDNPGQRFDDELLRALFPPAQPLDNFGIKAEDVKARIEALRGGTNQSEKCDY